MSAADLSHSRRLKKVRSPGRARRRRLVVSMNDLRLRALVLTLPAA
jgi:hypothetical protein